MEVLLHVFVTWALDGGEWSASRPLVPIGYYFNYVRSRVAVSIVTELPDGRPGLNSWHEQWWEFFSSPPRLGPSQPPIQWVPGVLKPWGKAAVA